MITLGKLEKVPVRDAWAGEASEFTPWLSLEENLALLGDEIGLRLELVETEAQVGHFRLDILARRAGTEEVVVIENQFNDTDHKHLGQLLTYAAGAGGDGTGARTVVWIAEHFCEPHRAALDWLNKCTEPGIGFFGVEVQLWRIGESPLAPKFSVVSKPNNWQKELTQETGRPASSELYVEFWIDFLTYCREHKSQLPLPTDPSHRSWLGITLGRTGFNVNLNARKKTRDVECQLWMDGPDARSGYSALFEMKDAINASLGMQVKFDDEARNRCKVYETSSQDINNREDWPTIHRWLKERGEAYFAFFKPVVKHLEL